MMERLSEKLKRQEFEAKSGMVESSVSAVANEVERAKVKDLEESLAAEVAKNEKRLENNEEKLKEFDEQEKSWNRLEGQGLKQADSGDNEERIKEPKNRSLLEFMERQILELEEELECPVCLEVATTAPIYKCPDDHLICRCTKTFI